MQKKTKDKYACFQWIRDIREQMTRDMEGMTLEERAAYMNARGEEAQASRQHFTPEEAKRIRDEYLNAPIPVKKEPKSKRTPRRAKDPVSKNTTNRKSRKPPGLKKISVK